MVEPPTSVSHKLQGVVDGSSNSKVVTGSCNHDGTGSPALCALTLKLLMWCQERGITLTAEYIPGFHNTLADRLSRRTLSQTEWSRKQSVVHQLFLRFKEP